MTTAADVYALGAILYEMLTGRPPHVGPTALDIVVDLLSGDVTAPRELNPRVDRDLESICLKCLAAAPAQRYHSAAALAADLEHWLVGEPISLRSTALATMLRSWLRQNLRTAGRTLAVGLTWGFLIGLGVWIFVNQSIARISVLYDQLPSVPRPWIAYAPVLPSWSLQALFVLLMVLLGMMGFAAAVFVRPTTRHAAVATGLAVGFMSGITAFALSLGWGPLSAKTLLPIRDDLVILSEAAFTRGGPGLPHPSDRLLAKYPDLETIPEWNRGNLIAGKMMGDMLMGLIAGLWWGMFLSLLICLVPAVSGTVTAWTLLQRHGSVKAALLPYIELAAVVTILTTLIAYYVMGSAIGAGIVVPEAGWLAAVFSACGLGVLAIWRRWPIPGRIVVHAAWIGVLVLFAFHEADYPTLERQAVQLVQEERWEKAVEEFEKVLRRQPDLTFTRFETAIVYLRINDRQAYDRHCRELLRNARGSHDPRIVDQAAKVCLLGGDQPLDLPLAVELADRSVRLRAMDPAINYFQMVRGMADYRSGKHAAALDWLRKSQEGRIRDVTCTALAFEAMALQRLGKRDEARLP